jgi:hypothetical protein
MHPHPAQQLAESDGMAVEVKYPEKQQVNYQD